MKKDLLKRTIFAALALAIFIPLLILGGLWLQIAGIDCYVRGS